MTFCSTISIGIYITSDHCRLVEQNLLTFTERFYRIMAANEGPKIAMTPSNI